MRSGDPDARVREFWTRLTPAEKEVLAELASGLSNREIARRLWKSEKTIEKHVGHIFAKLDLDGDVRRYDRRVFAGVLYARVIRS